jgi:hypothetical protein
VSGAIAAAEDGVFFIVPLFARAVALGEPSC